MQQDRDKAYNLANEQAEMLGLPKLKGTEKQVRWATVIRHELIVKFDEFIKNP